MDESEHVRNVYAFTEEGMEDLKSFYAECYMLVVKSREERALLAALLPLYCAAAMILWMFIPPAGWCVTKTTVMFYWIYLACGLVFSVVHFFTCNRRRAEKKAREAASEKVEGMMYTAKAKYEIDRMVEE